ncbi:hypothetical protein ACEWY4_023955 [Coilia grayii]|uniref:Ig-like domain-containing protein n=1 Tax=Coilia grayii TaxID=363190 RepID=A0ABD1IZ01_9TELE
MELQAFPTETVLMRCMFTQPGNTKLTQVSWIYEASEGERVNIAVFHPQYGESFPTSHVKDRVRFTQGSLQNPSIEISDLRMSDEGKYTCEYATYPSGNEQGTTTLTMLAKPKNKAEPVMVRAGSVTVVVARCEAAQGKPPATITWETDVTGGTANTTSLPQPDGTVTVRSEYWLTPVASLNNRDIKCKVAQRTQDKPHVFPLQLSIQYPPAVSIEGYDDNWYKGRTDAFLICQADANPEPTAVDWTSASGALPDTVQVVENRLMVKKVDDSVNTTFVCEVKNSLGSGKSQLTAVVIGESPGRACHSRLLHMSQLSQTHAHTHTHTHTHTQTHTYRHTQTRQDRHAHTHTDKTRHAHAHAHTHTHTHTHTHRHTHRQTETDRQIDRHT